MAIPTSRRLTSNHPLRGGKGSIYEGGIRVPAAIAWGQVSLNLEQRAMCEFSPQISTPTILKMLAADRPTDHQIDGVDFTRALKGEAMDREPMFTLGSKPWCHTALVAPFDLCASW